MQKPHHARFVVRRSSVLLRHSSTSRPPEAMRHRRYNQLRTRAFTEGRFVLSTSCRRDERSVRHNRVCHNKNPALAPSKTESTALSQRADIQRNTEAALRTPRPRRRAADRASAWPLGVTVLTTPWLAKATLSADASATQGLWQQPLLGRRGPVQGVSPWRPRLRTVCRPEAALRQACENSYEPLLEASRARARANTC